MSNKKKKKEQPPISSLGVSLGFALLGIGLVALAKAFEKNKEKPQPIETEDGGYATEVKDEKKLLMPPTSDDFIASSRFKED